MSQAMSWLWQCVFVGLGGFLGSVSRFGAGSLVYRLMPAPSLPYGTLVVNAVGCFAIGVLSGWVDSRGGISEEVRLLVFAGFLGGFTTFSAFGYETMALVREYAYFRAFINLALQLSIGFAAVWVGYASSR